MRNLLTILVLCLTISSNAQNINNTIKPYDEIITAKAITKKGVLQTHLLDNRLYFEIPETLLNKDILFVRHQYYSEYKQIKLIKQHNGIQIIIPPVKSEVGNITDNWGVKKELLAANFPILAEGGITGSNYVIDVTNLFLNPPKGLPGNGVKVFDGLAHINKILTVDNTIEIQTKKIITSKDGQQPITVNFSLVLLPEPMKPRLWDYRMGFGKESGKNGDNDIVRAAICRWRLEKKYPDQSLSEPVKPIILYFDPHTPDKWKPYIEAGINQWLPAFETAGFKNAIEIREPPINDKNWSFESTRYSYIHWKKDNNYRGKEGNVSASASKIIDKRSGEIIKADIKISEPNEFFSYQYFVRCSPLDARAQQYPFKDDLKGELIEFVTAHEIGHVFGLNDGNYGEFAYPFEKMRDKSWLNKMGHTPSIMCYSRHNFIVQPEDSIPPQLLIQKVGPTDLYSIRWGYTPFNKAKTPDEEIPYLDKIVSEQDTVPWYRFLPNDYGYKTLSPQATNEVVVTDNPVKSVELGINNLKRVIQLIPEATKNEFGTEVKKNLYYRALDLWHNQMESVVSLIGGYVIQRKSSGQGGPEHIPIPKSLQREAITFLNKEVFQAPLWMVPKDIIRSFESGSEISHLNRSIHIITRRTTGVLKMLFDMRRLKHLEETDLTSQNTYPMATLFQDLSDGIFEELKVRDIKINPYRQEIQMAYIFSLKEGINAKRKDPFGNDVYSNGHYTRGVLYNTLGAIKHHIEKALKKVKEPKTRVHLQLCLLEIDKAQILN